MVAGAVIIVILIVVYILVQSVHITLYLTPAPKSDRRQNSFTFDFN